jgi:8-oxo-dGTP pyrophosphatase MutT (NUDIX family)
MNILTTIGQEDDLIQYTNRPTVKVLIKKDDKLLILNEGFLPGGGINQGESDQDAIKRELQEELGVTVKDIQIIGTVVQYRNLLDRKYIINGYTATLETAGGTTNPQDEGEAQFTILWLTQEEAFVYFAESIEKAKLKPMDDDAYQGKLYNMMTTYEFLKNIR